MQARRAIEAGDADVVLAGGVESMSRAPWVLLKPAKGFPAGHETLHSTTLGWRMVNPEMPDEWTISLGESAEKLADHLRRSPARRRTRSRCAATSGAARPGTTASTTTGSCPVAGHRARPRRGHPRRLVAGEARQAQAGVRRKDGTVTAGNASPLNDGAAAAAARGERPPRRPGASRSRGSPAAAPHGVDPRRLRHRPGRGRQPRARRAPASAGTTSTSSSSTRRSPSQSLACLASGRSSTPRRSTPTAARSRSATRSARPARASSARLAHELRRRGGGCGRGRDLHRRRPGPRRRCWRAGMTDVLPRYAAMSDVHPPLDYPRLQVDARCATRSSRCIQLPQRLTEITGAAARRRAASRAGDHDLTAPARRRAARRADHRPRPRARRPTAGRCRTRWSRSGRPTPPAATGTRGDHWPAPLDPNFTGVGPLRDRRRGPLPRSSRSSRAPTRGATTTTPGARRTSTSRCSGRAFTQRLVTQMYFPGDPLFCPGPDLQLGPRRPGARADDLRASTYDATEPTGRWPSTGTSCCAGAEATPFEEEHVTTTEPLTHAVADRRAVPRDRPAVGGRPRRRAARARPGAHPHRTARVLDGAGDAGPRRAGRDLAGRPGRALRHPTTRAGPTCRGFRGFGRASTDDDGAFEIRTRQARAAAGRRRRRRRRTSTSPSSPAACSTACVTRIYFADEAEANAADPVLATRARSDRRATLIAAAGRTDGYRFDIRLQGERETVFFDV